MSDDIEKAKVQAALVEAEAKRSQAEAALAQARKGCTETLVIKVLAPVALLIVGPWATYYFSSKAEEGIQKVEANTREMNDLHNTIDNMQEIVEHLSGVLADANADREHEMTRMRATVDKLDGTLKMIMVQMALRRAIERNRSPWEVSPPRGDVLRSRSEEVISEAVDQLAPLADREELESLAREALEKMASENPQPR